MLVMACHHLQKFINYSVYAICHLFFLLHFFFQISIPVVIIGLECWFKHKDISIKFVFNWDCWWSDLCSESCVWDTCSNRCNSELVIQVSIKFAVFCSRSEYEYSTCFSFPCHWSEIRDWLLLQPPSVEHTLHYDPPTLSAIRYILIKLRCLYCDFFCLAV